MARRNPGQQLARHRLGTALKKLREDANIRVEAAAAELECSSAKISRLENGLGPAKLWDVRILLDLYGLDDVERRSELEQWARETKSPGWWEADSDLTTEDLDRYLAVETAAAVHRSYSTPVLPSLLHTHEYAAAHLRTFHPDWSDDDIDRFARLRVERRDAIMRSDDPLWLDAVIDEGAVRRQVGSRDVHRAQLRWLSELLDDFALRERRHVVVRVLPFGAGVPSRALGSFTIFEPQSRELDPVSAHIEHMLGGTWLEADATAPLIDIFRELAEMSLDQQESRRFLRDVLGDL